MSGLSLPPDIVAALDAQGVTVRSAAPVAGGMINQAARVETSNEPLFVKWHSSAPLGMFGAEAAGLAALVGVGAIRVPQVVAQGDAPAFLATEFLPSETAPDTARFARHLGEQLAGLHQRSAEQNQPFGFATDNFIGVLPQANLPRETSWPAFYRNARLLPQIARAKTLGRVPPERERLLDLVVERLETLLGDLPPETSLLHGDLWAGNLLCLPGGVPGLVDPAVYYGPREMEIAFAELFGGFPGGWIDHYRQAWPLPPGYEARRPLHQLYPLLVHLNHFGEGYGSAVERACRDALLA